MKTPSLSDLKSSLGCKLFQYPTKPLISIVEKKTRRDAMKTGELSVPAKPPLGHTDKNKDRNHNSTISPLHINLLNISQLLGETRSSRDSVGLPSDSLTQTESECKGTKTLDKTSVLINVFFSSLKLNENAIFSLHLSVTLQVCLWYIELVHDRKRNTSQPGQDNESKNNIVTRNLIFVMKKYYWPPWPLLTHGERWKKITIDVSSMFNFKTFEQGMPRLSATKTTFFNDWAKH